MQCSATQVSKIIIIIKLVLIQKFISYILIKSSLVYLLIFYIGIYLYLYETKKISNFKSFYEKIKFIFIHSITQICVIKIGLIQMIKVLKNLSSKNNVLLLTSPIKNNKNFLSCTETDYDFKEKKTQTPKENIIYKDPTVKLNISKTGNSLFSISLSLDTIKT